MCNSGRSILFRDMSWLVFMAIMNPFRTAAAFGGQTCQTNSQVISPQNGTAALIKGLIVVTVGFDGLVRGGELNPTFKPFE